MDSDNKDALFRLLRFNVNYSKSVKTWISLDDYIKKMSPNQKTIYFTFGQTYDSALNSPFYEPFKDTELPVLVITN